MTEEALTALIRKLLTWQYEHTGMGLYRCRSCGAYAFPDDETGHTRREACSLRCPWEQARQVIGDV